MTVYNILDVLTAGTETVVEVTFYDATRCINGCAGDLMRMLREDVLGAKVKSAWAAPEKKLFIHAIPADEEDDEYEQT